MKKGFSLVECTLAGSITCLMVLVLFEGIIVASRVAHENSQYLAASDYAFDLAWQKFNASKESFRNHRAYSTITVPETISSNAAPVLFYPGSPAMSYVSYYRVEGSTNGVFISVNVEWGPAGSRKRLNSKSGTSCPSLNQESVLFRNLDLERSYQKRSQ